MRPHLRRSIIAFLLVSLPLATTLVVAQSGTPTPPAAPSASGLDLGAIDRRANPCTDFYQFACGEWTARNPIPADRSRWGRFDELQEKNNDILRRILETAAAGRDPEARQIGDYYASCMDEAGVEKKGASPLDGAPEGDCRPQKRWRPAGTPRRPSRERHAGLLPLRRGSRFQGREDGDCGPRPGRPGPARPRLLLPRRREVGRHPAPVRRACREHGRALRHAEAPGRRGSRRGDAP